MGPVESAWLEIVDFVFAMGGGGTSVPDRSTTPTTAGTPVGIRKRRDRRPREDRVLGLAVPPVLVRIPAILMAMTVLVVGGARRNTPLGSSLLLASREILRM